MKKYLVMMSLFYLFQILVPLFLLADEGTVKAKIIMEGSQVKGGFCVHLGATNGKLTVALNWKGRFLVHGQTLPANLQKIRDYVRSKKVYGLVSIDAEPISPLPYTDGIVSLLVIEDLKYLIGQGFDENELLRVLAPKGVVCIFGNFAAKRLSSLGFQNIRIISGYTFAQKPRPATMDEWTHWRHSGRRTASSKDLLVGVNDNIRWIDSPRRARGHSSPPAMCLSAGGRLFYVYDYGLLFQGTPNRATLVARDAYNGIVLWKKPVSAKASHGNLNYPGRAVVVTNQFIYAPLKTGGPLVKMDAASGKEIYTYKGSHPDSVIHLGTDLLLLAMTTVRLVDEKTGQEKWRVKSGKGGRHHHIFVSGDKAFMQMTRSSGIICLNISDGKEVWKWEDASINEFSYFSIPTSKILLHSSKNLLKAVSIDDGKEKWRYDYKMSNRGSPQNVFYVNGLIWVHNTLHALGGRKGEAWHGIDPVTGKLQNSIPVSFVDKCALGKATGRYLISGRLDFTDTRTGKSVTSSSVRSSCRFGALPANGMLYNFPTDCQCYPQIKGIMGLGSQVAKDQSSVVFTPIEKGLGKATGVLADVKDWPVYRGNMSRHGSANLVLPALVAKLWGHQFVGNITAPIIAKGKVYLSEVSQHRIHALDADSGKHLWAFDTGGRVSQAPTYYEGAVIFGCEDGWLYSISSESGKMIWRFHAGASPKRLIAYGQTASLWPILGSVLVEDHKIYFSAGRHSGLKSGLAFYCLNSVDGKVIWRHKLKRTYFQDMMVKATGSVFMGPQIRMNDQDGALISVKKSGPVLLPSKSSPFMDDTFSNRTLWSYAGVQGQMLSINDNYVVGFSSFGDSMRKYAIAKPGGSGYRLFVKSLGKSVSVKVKLPIRPRALLLAKEKIFLTGYEDIWPLKKALLLCYSAKEGRELSRIEVDASPVFDGLAAAQGRLYIAGEDGQLRCYGKK